MARARPGRLADSVYERLIEEVFSGDLAAGERLSVPAIAGRLGVSRSPVRDAVLRLAQEGLADGEPGRGAVVARVQSTDLAGIYEVREVLEGLAARLAVENAGRRLVKALAEVLERDREYVRSGDIGRHMEADMAFHSQIREASGNPEVVRVLDSIQSKVRLAMLTTTVSGGLPQALRDHRAILTAIKRADPEAAESAARKHVARLRAVLLAADDHR